jgi:chorismate synthase
MNGFGRLLRISLFGESHGPAIGVIIDGCPAGLPLSVEDLLPDLTRRKAGKPGTTARKEEDIPSVLSGIFRGRTTGGAITFVFENRDTDSRSYESLVNKPRPGQADFAASRKYGGFNDYRGGGFFSGRLTAPLVAAGVVAKKLIQPVKVEARLIEVGGLTAIDEVVARAIRDQDSVGGVIECVAHNVAVGLGEPLFDSAESLLSHLIFSIPGVKGIEFGAGFAGSRIPGSQYNDQIISTDGRTKTNNAGGINGGMTNGNPVVFRVAVRPTSSISLSQQTIEMTTGESVEITVGGRHDACFALRVPVIVEAATALVLADLMLMEQLIPRVSQQVESPALSGEEFNPRRPTDGPERDSQID